MHSLALPPPSLRLHPVGGLQILVKSSPERRPGVHERALTAQQSVLPRLAPDELRLVLEHLAGERLGHAISTDAYRNALPLALTCKAYYKVFVESVRGVALLPIGFAAERQRRLWARQCRTRTLARRRTPAQQTPETQPWASAGWHRGGQLGLGTGNPWSPASERGSFVTAKSKSKVPAILVQRMLTALPKVVELEISTMAELTDTSMWALTQACPNLRSLRVVANTQITAYSIRTLQQCKELQYLSMPCCQGLRDEAASFLASMQNLRGFCLSQCKISDTFFELLFKEENAVPSLQFIKIVSCLGVTDSGVARLTQAAGSRLREVNLSGCRRVTNASFSMLAEKCPRLEFLDAGYNHNLNMDCAGDLGACASLSRLELNDCNGLTDSAIAEISQNKKLEFVKLSWCRSLTDAAVASLGSCYRLHVADFSGCHLLTDGAVRILAHLPSLQCVKLSYCTALTDESAEALACAVNEPLQEVDVSHCSRISEAGLGRLRSTVLHVVTANE